MIIDYHSHLPWNRQTNEYQVESLIQDMNDNGIDVRVISALEGESISQQNDAMLNAVRAYPDRLIGCAVINPKKRNCLDELKRVAKTGLIRAIELDSLEHNYYPETVESIDALIELAIDYNLLVNVYTGWGPRTMPAQWAFYAKRHPKVKMILLHMGTTDFGYGCVELVPEYDNLYVETSCMYEFPILRKALKKIDSTRFLFGTHYPHKFTPCSLHAFDMLDLSEQFKEQLFCSNAEQLLQLNKRNSDRK